MPEKTKIQRADKSNWLSDFHRRWNIDLNEKERWDSFRSRILNAYMPIGRIINTHSQHEQEFLEIIGIHKNPGSNWDLLSTIGGIEHSPTYNYFSSTTNIKKFILGIEVIFRMSSLTKTHKDGFLSNIENVIKITGVPLEVKRTSADVIFYPAGAKLLDEKLVNDNLDWLSAHPKSYDCFKKALSEIGIVGKEREVVDNLRLSLELLMKDVLGNRKSLENQKTDIGKFLKSKGVSSEISKMFWQLLDYYSKYQNDKAKHNIAVPSEEVEFILYLTGTIIRFLSTR